MSPTASPETLLQQTVILELISSYLDTSAKQQLAQTSSVYQLLAWPYLPPLKVAIGQNLASLQRTHSKKGKYESAIDLSANDTATENSKVAAMQWLRHIEPVLTGDYRFIIQDIGQDPQDVLQVICHLPVSDSSCRARSVYISCRDGDIAFALDRYSRAWAIAATPASERTSGFNITALSSIKREHLPDWLVFDGCLSSNGSPISRTGTQPLRMPYPMRLPNILWRLRPSASGRLLDTHETSDGRRVSGVELMAAMMSCLAKDLVLEESKQMIITFLADGDSSQDTDRGNDAARHDTAMKDLLALEQAFKTTFSADYRSRCAHQIQFGYLEGMDC